MLDLDALCATVDHHRRAHNPFILAQSLAFDAQCLFHKKFVRLWVMNPTADDYDALGVVLMGGEL